MAYQGVVVGVTLGEGVAKDGVASKAERRDCHWLGVEAVGSGLIDHSVGGAAAYVDRHKAAAAHVVAFVEIGWSNALGVGVQVAGVFAKVGVIQFVPRVVELATVAAAHAHGEEVDDARAVEVAILKQHFGLDEQHELSQELA